MLTFTTHIHQATDHKAKIIVVASEKGGVAKTTTTVNLGHAFALQGYNTLIIDADPRGDASTALGLPAAPGIYQHLVLGQALASQVIPATRPATSNQPALERPYLTILRGDQTTRRTASLLHDEIVSSEKPADFIHSAWRSAAQEPPVDLILIDTPPNGGFWPEQNYRVADLIIIPTSMDNIDKGAAQATYNKIRQMGIHAPILILPTIFVAKETVDEANLAELRQTFTPELVLEPIPRSAAIKQSRAYGQTIFEYAPKSAPAKAIQRVANQLLAFLTETA